MQMADTTPVATFISLRDKILTALDKLAGEGVTSYTIGDQTYTLRDVDDMLQQVERLDRLIAVKTRTAGSGGRNRIDLRRFHA